MRVDQPFVDPVARRKFAVVYLARRNHHLSYVAGCLVAINVNIGEIIVSTDSLNLFKRVPQCLPVPEPNVFEGRAVSGEVKRLYGTLGLKIALLDLVQCEATASPLDVMFNIRSFAIQFIWFDDETLNIGRNEDH